MAEAGQGENGLKAVEWRPVVNPWWIAASVMISTFMVVLDSSVANVSLPHIAGNLSASTDESTWVLTSYLVANAIMLPASGWLARRMGRKRLLMSSILLFTFASVLCGVSLNLPMLILARILQGIGGGGMQPLAQSILLESFPPRQHGVAMAVYGLGVVVAPVIGPTLGGWITDSYSWRWIFYINIPFGALALFMVRSFIEDPPYLRHRVKQSIDGLGFGLMALWLGSLQLILDKGQEADWFESSWICATAVLSVAALIGFVFWELTTKEPIVHLRILKERNFGLGVIVTGLYGFTLYGITALLPLFLQTLMGYPALDSGLAVSPRGVGSILSMAVVGWLSSKVDARLLLATGFGIQVFSTLMLSQINLGIGMGSVVIPNLINGFAGGFVFVPLTTLAMSRLERQQIGNAAGIYNLMRNIGGSIGIATVSTMLVRGAQRHQNDLAAHNTVVDAVTQQVAAGLTGKFAMGGAGQANAGHLALGSIYRSMQQQASLLAYADNFRLMALLTVLCIPLVALFGRAQKR